MDMIACETEGGVATIRLERPERKNALSAEMIARIGDALSAARGDDGCRCVVLSGSGGNFCAGRELGDLPEPGLESTLGYDDAYTAIFRNLQALGKPSVALVEGYAVAGGFTLAMGCDFVLATEEARFGALEMKNGFPAALNTALLSQLCPPRLALEWLVTGELVPARRLYEHGLVNRLLPDAAALAEAARAFISVLLERDPLAVRLARDAFKAAREMPLAEALAYGRNLNALLLASGRIEEAARGFEARQRARGKGASDS